MASYTIGHEYRFAHQMFFIVPLLQIQIKCVYLQHKRINNLISDDKKITVVILCICRSCNGSTACAAENNVADARPRYRRRPLPDVRPLWTHVDRNRPGPSFFRRLPFQVLSQQCLFAGHSSQQLCQMHVGRQVRRPLDRNA